MKTKILTIPEYAKFLDENCKKSIQCKDAASHGFVASIMNGVRYILGATEDEVMQIDQQAIVD
jgi:hypothetical protein